MRWIGVARGNFGRFWRLQPKYASLQAHYFTTVEGNPADHAHYAFRASDRATVRACYELGTAFNALDRPPALAPHIHPNYYAGYLRDPDGRLVEFVCHEAE